MIPYCLKNTELIINNFHFYLCSVSHTMMTLMDHKTEIQNSIVVNQVSILLLRIIKDKKIILKGTFYNSKKILRETLWTKERL